MYGWGAARLARRTGAGAGWSKNINRTARRSGDGGASLRGIGLASRAVPMVAGGGRMHIYIMIFAGVHHTRARNMLKGVGFPREVTAIVLIRIMAMVTRPSLDFLAGQLPSRMVTGGASRSAKATGINIWFGVWGSSVANQLRRHVADKPAFGNVIKTSLTSRMRVLHVVRTIDSDVARKITTVMFAYTAI